MSFSLRSILYRAEYPLLFSAIILTVGGGWVVYQNRQKSMANIFPQNVYIDDVPMSGKTKAEALDLLNQLDHPLTYSLSTPQVVVSSSSAQLGIQRDYPSVLDQAFTETVLTQSSLSAISPFTPPMKKYHSSWLFNQDAIAQMITSLKQKADQPGKEPAATLTRSGNPNTLAIEAGKAGQEVSATATLIDFMRNVQQNQASTSATIVATSTPLTSDEAKAALDRAKLYVGKQIVFQKEGLDKVINDQKLLSFLSFPGGFSDKAVTTLLDQWQKDVNAPPQDAVFDFDSKTLHVSKFEPPRNGRTVNADETRKEITQATAEIEQNTDPTKKVFTFALPMQETPPAKTLASTNDLGIQERIGFGDSEYEHSIPGRIHNVSLTASRINNTIVPNGAEFSFNKTLGDVSAETGFQPAYVIKNGQTVLGDGGGVCQVSSTVFRAVLNAGLQVTKRFAHSYRVSYYELNAKPGIDATVYAGDIDFRFKNDTGHALLIHTETYPKDLYMLVEIYGTSDGRQTEIVDHKTWDFVAAPAARYQDDPSLKRGVIKQVDFAAAGIKASFTNVVKDKDGKVLREDTYFSNYKPWQAVYLVGTG